MLGPADLAKRQELEDLARENEFGNFDEKERARLVAAISADLEERKKASAILGAEHERSKEAFRELERDMDENMGVFK